MNKPCGKCWSILKTKGGECARCSTPKDGWSALPDTGVLVPTWAVPAPPAYVYGVDPGAKSAFDVMQKMYEKVSEEPPLSKQFEAMFEAIGHPMPMKGSTQRDWIHEFADGYAAAARRIPEPGHVLGQPHPDPVRACALIPGAVPRTELDVILDMGFRHWERV